MTVAITLAEALHHSADMTTTKKVVEGVLGEEDKKNEEYIAARAKSRRSAHFEHWKSKGLLLAGDFSQMPMKCEDCASSGTLAARTSGGQQRTGPGRNSFEREDGQARRRVNGEWTYRRNAKRRGQDKCARDAAFGHISKDSKHRSSLLRRVKSLRQQLHADGKEKNWRGRGARAVAQDEDPGQEQALQEIAEAVLQFEE